MVKKIHIYFTTAAIIFMVFMVLFLFGAIKKNSLDLLSQKKALSDLKVKTENSEQLEGIYQNYKLNLEKIDTLFVEKENPIEFIEFLEKTANNSNLSLEISSLSSQKIESDPSAGSGQAPWNSLNLQLNTQAQFPDFLKFLEKIENSPYLIEVSNLNIKKTTKESLGVLAILSIKVYTK